MLYKFIPHTILFCLGIVLGAWAYHKFFQPEPPGETVIAEHENETSEQVVEKVVITKPSGVKIVKDTKIVTNTRTATKEVTKSVFKPKPSYSIGVTYSLRPGHSEDFTRDRLLRPALDVGFRIGQTPLSITTGYDFDRSGYLLGIRYEF